MVRGFVVINWWRRGAPEDEGSGESDCVSSFVMVVACHKGTKMRTTGRHGGYCMLRLWGVLVM